MGSACLVSHKSRHVRGPGQAWKTPAAMSLHPSGKEVLSSKSLAGDDLSHGVPMVCGAGDPGVQQ